MTLAAIAEPDIATSTATTATTIAGLGTRSFIGHLLVGIEGTETPGP